MATSPSAIAGAVFTTGNCAALDIGRVIRTAVAHVCPAISPAGGCRNADSVVASRIAGTATWAIQSCQSRCSKNGERRKDAEENLHCQKPRLLERYGRFFFYEGGDIRE
ncbi:hypothetical protein ACJ73_09709 [Blastomyces percursus]|uniref:Uncharacterized protein n=1 Tax=Blastomyces percursus TaxID=1658174 RepID=A0A1J9Q6G5_9EURO|nr:hypothetical protein ACJ73_09709 [Blastomyces percursus]